MNKTTMRAGFAALAIAAFAAGGALANPMVGGAAMYDSKTIVENAMNSKDHTTLVSAVKSAGLVETLSGKGPFTVFAPVNAAFDQLPAGTVDMLMKPEGKEKLTKILTAHVVAGKMSSKELMDKAKTMKDAVALKTVSGDTLWAKLDGMTLWLIDENGGTARVTIPDVNQSNGLIHVVDKVLLPK